jgi:hypothetical protein
MLIKPKIKMGRVISARVDAETEKRFDNIRATKTKLRPNGFSVSEVAAAAIFAGLLAVEQEIKRMAK